MTTAGKVIRCKAAICRNPEEELVLEEIEVDPPKAYEVRLKILCTSLCHSDVTFWKMKPGHVSAFPRILGHEAVGEVESVGEGVEGWKEGELALPVFVPDCEECRDCTSGKSNICSKFGRMAGGFGMPRDGTSRFRDGEGAVIHHLFGVSSFSEYTVVDVVNLVKIGVDLPLDKACLLSCGVSTGKKFGITDFVNPTTTGEKRVSEVIKEMTDGGADYCFECIGLASLMADAFSSSREELNLESFVTHEVGFKDINKAFQLLLEGKSLRCLIWMDGCQ
ncbi:Alcohol dehydrogenase-like 1 [Linum grandiflorum]